MIQTGSDPRLRQLRKYESILVLSGSGVMIFGLWSIIRFALYYIIKPFDPEEYIGKSDYSELLTESSEVGVDHLAENMGTIIVVIVFTVLAIDLLLRIYIGMSARAYGRGKKSGFFIFAALLIAVFELLGIIVSVESFWAPIIAVIREQSVDAYAETASSGDHVGSVSIFVDITSFLILIELVFSAFKVRKLRKALGIRTRKDTKEDYYDDMAELGESLIRIDGLSDLNPGSLDTVSSISTGDK
jgi:hypothetical protein